MSRVKFIASDSMIDMIKKKLNNLVKTISIEKNWMPTKQINMPDGSTIYTDDNNRQLKFPQGYAKSEFKDGQLMLNLTYYKNF